MSRTRERTSGRAVAATSLAGLLLLSAGEARADLRSDVARLSARYRELGATVTDGGSYFLASGRSARVRGVSSPTMDTPCLSWVALGVRGAAFSLERQAAERPPAESLGHEGDGPEPEDEVEVNGAPVVERSTRAGVAVMTSCFDARPAEAPELRLAYASLRGAVDVLVVSHRGSLPPVEEVLVERAHGPVPEEPSSLSSMPVEVVDARVRALNDQALRDGASAVLSSAMRSRPDGTGERVVGLEPGCHRLSFTVDSGGEPADLDVELRARTGGEPLRFDRSHAPDARIELCLEEPRSFELRWGGAGGALDVRMLDARFERPTLPPSWSSAERAAFAWGLWRRRATRLGAPWLEWRGVAGVTRVPVHVEPGGCYLAGLAVTPGDGRDALDPGGNGAGARLRVQVGVDTFQEETLDLPRGVAVAFCAGSSDLARISVEARGTRVLHRVALWRVGGP